MNDDSIDAEKLLSALFAPPRREDPDFDPSTCSHNRTESDNYGESCYDCGKPLRGFGYGGWFGTNLSIESQCIHEWFRIGDGYRQCMYCEKVEVEQNDE